MATPSRVWHHAKKKKTRGHLCKGESKKTDSSIQMQKLYVSSWRIETSTFFGPQWKSNNHTRAVTFNTRREKTINEFSQHSWHIISRWNDKGLKVVTGLSWLRGFSSASTRRNPQFAMQMNKGFEVLSQQMSGCKQSMCPSNNFNKCGSKPIVSAAINNFELSNQQSFQNYVTYDCQWYIHYAMNICNA